jgi:hypothetical protein
MAAWLCCVAHHDESHPTVTRPSLRSEADDATAADAPVRGGDRARETRAPDARITQWDYLHLSGLRRGLVASLGLVLEEATPVLDLYCGTKPYLELIPWRPVWGADLDDHFGRADVLATVPLPFRDGTFGLVLCSQALNLVDDPVETVREIARVVRPGGYAIVTIPHLFLAEERSSDAGGSMTSGRCSQAETTYASPVSTVPGLRSPSCWDAFRCSLDDVGPCSRRSSPPRSQ